VRTWWSAEGAGDVGRARESSAVESRAEAVGAAGASAGWSAWCRLRWPTAGSAVWKAGPVGGTRPE
jgi:hypothetical protein